MGVTLREDACIYWLNEHAKKKSFHHPAPCQCPWCKKARTIVKRKLTMGRLVS